MFVSDIKVEFYNLLQNQRVIVFCSLDVDALCSCFIFQRLFQIDGILYSIIPVSSIQDLEEKFSETPKDVKHVLFINCGGTVDLVNILCPPEDVTFYVSDSHRPLDVSNIYNSVQVKLLLSLDEVGEFPDFNSIFRDDDLEPSDSESDKEEEENQDPQRLSRAERFEKRRQKAKEIAAWKRKRADILFHYGEFNSWGVSSSFGVFQIAWQLSKDTIEMLWAAIVGTTEQMVARRVDNVSYSEQISQLQTHLSRHSSSSSSTQTLKVSAGRYLHLLLLNQWTIYDSMLVSIPFCTRFKTWRGEAGLRRMRGFLAECGISLKIAQQTFCNTEFELTCSSSEESLVGFIEPQLERYEIDKDEVTFQSFSIRYGYSKSVTALDTVYAIVAILSRAKVCTDSLSNRYKLDSSSFHEALNALDLRNHANTLFDGLELGKSLVSAIFNLTQFALDSVCCKKFGPLLFATLPNDRDVVHGLCLSTPSNAVLFCHHFLACFATQVKDDRAKVLPLLLVMPICHGDQLVLVCGMPPISHDQGKNCFGKAFEVAAANSDCQIMFVGFDLNVVLVKSSDQRKFIDAIVALLS